MAKRVTQEDIQRMNELYFEYHSYAAVARETGWSASTVSRYVDKTYSPAPKKEVAFNPAEIKLPSVPLELFRGVQNYGELCVYSEEEKQHLEKMREEKKI